MKRIFQLLENYNYLGHETDFEIFWEKYFVQETDFAPLSGATLELRRHKEGRDGRGLVKIRGEGDKNMAKQMIKSKDSDILGGKFVPLWEMCFTKVRGRPITKTQNKWAMLKVWMEIIGWVGFQLLERRHNCPEKETKELHSFLTQRRGVEKLFGHFDWPSYLSPFLPLTRPSLSLICPCFLPPTGSLISASLTSDIEHSLIKPSDDSCGHRVTKKTFWKKDCWNINLIATKVQTYT